MRSPLAKAAGSLAAAFILLTTVAPASAGWWRHHDLWQSDWRAAYLRGDWDGVIRTGSLDWRVGQAVLGKYPYHDYGYNNGACIGYEPICDQWGNIIGQRVILIC